MGGGRRETGTAEIERAIERTNSRHATWATTGDEPRDSRSVRGAPTPGHCTNREGTRASEAGAKPGRRLDTRRENLDNAESAVSLSPSTNTRAKYCQPHRSRGEHAHTTGSLGRTAEAAWHRPPASFGRTAGDNRRYWGGYQINEKRTERRQEEEREGCTRGQTVWRHGARAGESRGGGGERGDQKAINGTIIHSAKP